MDEKEKVLLNQFINLIENREFDEKSIFAFLILVRGILKTSNFPILSDFADLIAHRKRDRGCIMKCIKGAIDNNYELIDGKKVKGYHGIEQDEWQDEWFRFGKMIGLALNDYILDELMLCIFSLTQFSCYEDGHGHKGTVILALDKKGSLDILTTEAQEHSLYICFSQWGSYDFQQVLPAGIIEKPVWTTRIDGRLRLTDGDAYII